MSLEVFSKEYFGIYSIRKVDLENILRLRRFMKNYSMTVLSETVSLE